MFSACVYRKPFAANHVTPAVLLQVKSVINRICLINRHQSTTGSLGHVMAWIRRPEVTARDVTKRGVSVPVEWILIAWISAVAYYKSVISIEKNDDLIKLECLGNAQRFISYVSVNYCVILLSVQLKGLFIITCSSIIIITNMFFFINWCRLSSVGTFSTLQVIIHTISDLLLLSDTRYHSHGLRLRVRLKNTYELLNRRTHIV